MADVDIAGNNTVKLNLSGLNRFRDAIEAGAGTPEIAKTLKQFRFIYLSYVQMRAIAASRGDGTWKELAPSTIRRRRKPARHNRAKSPAAKAANRASKRVSKKSLRRVKASDVSSTLSRAKSGAGATGRAAPMSSAPSRSIAILKDKGILLNVLTPTIESAPGQLTKVEGLGIRVGYGGGAPHPNGKATVADIARAHQLGNPKRKLPKREIIVEPDKPTQETMANAAEANLADLLKRVSIQTDLTGTASGMI